MSLSQTEDAHVGGYENYTTKICCSAVICPSKFAWNAQSQTCVPTFQACYRGNTGSTTSDPGYACQNKWRPATNPQTGPYWQDALTPATDDCFASNPISGENGYACCLLTTYAGKEYGEYQANELTFTQVPNAFVP